MSGLLSWSIGATLACYAVASLLVLVRLVRGPRAQDRVFALDLLYLHALLALLVFAILHGSDVYFAPALLVALLAFASSAALAKFILRGEVIE